MARARLARRIVLPLPFNVHGVIDLHCHVLPGIDDGPSAMEASVRMVQAALEDGIQTIVATPHVNRRYHVDGDTIAARVADLRAALAEEELPVTLLFGAEISLSRLPGLDDDHLRTLCLGQSSYVLVESPYTSTGSLIEESIFDLHARGFRPLLAHPERCPEFQRNIPRLRCLVAGGVACSVSAGSIQGHFGDVVRRFSNRLLEEGLVHNVSSDAHDLGTRPPALRAAFCAPKSAFGSPGLQLWLTGTVPAAILADEPLPPRPSVSKPSRWRRLTDRR